MSHHRDLALVTNSGGIPTSDATTRRRPSPLVRVLTAMLQHPMTVRVKRPLRDAWWSVAGRSLENPTLSSKVRSVLFVCKGNICRSPFAARLAERDPRGRGIQWASAGLAPSQAAAPPEDAHVAAAPYGVVMSHQPQRLTHDLIDRYDLVVVMEAAQLRDLRRRHPHAADRFFLLPLVERRPGRGYARYNIADPFGHGPAAFAIAYRRLHGAVGDLLDALARDKVE